VSAITTLQTVVLAYSTPTTLPPCGYTVNGSGRMTFAPIPR
jgi:hypothetical protein